MSQSSVCVWGDTLAWLRAQTTWTLSYTWPSYILRFNLEEVGDQIELLSISLLLLLFLSPLLSPGWHRARRGPTKELVRLSTAEINLDTCFNKEVGEQLGPIISGAHEPSR